jgi:hypothetical protein
LHLILPCGECIRTGRLGGAFAYAEYRDDDCYDSVCPAGHKSVAVLQQQRFELLFEMGSYAVLDGYYREAISSFAASLERFFEFAIRVLLLETSGSDVLFQSCWKKVSSQSERQLGAFTLLWASRFKDVPPILPTKLATFRNEVIHKGKIPSRKEAIDFGDEILLRLAGMIERLETELSEQIILVTHFHLREITPRGAGGPVTTTGENTIVSLARDKKAEPIQSLDFHLRELDKKRTSLDQFMKLVKGRGAGA